MASGHPGGSDHPMYKHGESHKTKEWRAWAAMIRRCSYPAMPRYSRYAGRGITVCDEWRHDYSQFLKDVGRAPTEDHQLDRINNDGNYEASNVKWSTRSEQIRNSSKARYLEHDGQRMTMGDWSKQTGIKRRTLQMRLDKYGYSIADALTTPVGLHYTDGRIGFG